MDEHAFLCDSRLLDNTPEATQIEIRTVDSNCGRGCHHGCRYRPIWAR